MGKPHRSNGATGILIGTIFAWQGGYYTDGVNGGYTDVLAGGNTVADANSYANKFGCHVCNGAALNDPDSPIFNGSGRYLPNLTDDRFLMGATAAGGVGGSSTMSHTHGVTSNVTVGNHSTLSLSNHTTLAATIPNHKHQVADATTLDIHFYDSTGANTASVLSSTRAAGGLGSTVVSSGSIQNLYSKTDGGGGAVSFSQNITAHSFSQNITAHSVTNNAVTSGAASNTENRPKYLSVFFMIKVK